jgi:hypothetical protein
VQYRLTLRQIVGPNPNSVPQAGLDTKARDQEIAQLIVAAIDQGADPNGQLLYNPINWSNASNVPFPPLSDWLQPPVKLTINGRPDSFSQRYTTFVVIHKEDKIIHLRF